MLPRLSTPKRLVAALLLGLTGSLSAAPGSVLLEYQASTGTMPQEQGWEHEGRCLKDSCPGTICVYPPGDEDCWWQGCRDFDEDLIIDNNCVLNVGCRKSAEHYNAPATPLGIGGSCSYTEWMAYDDGDNTSGRPLTINDAPTALPTNPPTIRVVDAPPYGANQFPGAPLGYPPLRLSTGSGDDAGKVLPAESSSNRNGGKIKVRSKSMLLLPGGVTDVTVVARMAFGPWALKTGHAIVEMRLPSAAADRHWRFGITPPNSIPGHGGEERLGIMNRSVESEPSVYPFGPLSVRTYNSGPETWSGGEFYTVRLICRADGTWSAYLNEQPSTVVHGALGMPGEDDDGGSDLELQWGLIDNAGGASCGDVGEGCGKTMWLDYIQVLEGAVTPTGCADPVFDLDGNGAVDSDDFNNGVNADFLYCATGPAPAAGHFAGLPQWCRCLDINDDQAIDQTDFGGFQRCLGLTGAALEACDD